MCRDLNMGLEKEMGFHVSHSECESREFTRTWGVGWHPLWDTRESRKGKLSLGCLVEIWCGSGRD